jgi:GTPase SAR1 family protein
MKKDKQLVKLMILGDVNTGKTNLLLRYCDA